MTSEYIRTDVLAIGCVKDFVFVGMGSMLYLYKNYKFVRKLNCLRPSNIHGIVAGPNNKLAVFGAKSMCICNIMEIGNDVRIRKKDTDQFNDWIIAVKWISFKEQTQLAILFAHNYISIYDIFNKTSQVIRCEETCILYGGSILGTCQESLVIFSGTVFQEILIWKIDNRYYDINKSMPVLHRLTGHKGVIFSVICDLDLRLICSTSDDRSVRFWEISEHENSESNNINWQTVKIVLKKTMFIHTARVWRALIRNNVVFTVGEDALVCTWSLSGDLLHKAYYKAPIWSIDVSEDNMTIYLGGSDGSVYMQPFESYKSPEIISILGNDSPNFPKYLSYLLDGTFLVYTELGTLLHYNKEMVHKSTIYLTKDRYHIMQVSPDRTTIAFASREGCLLLYIYKEYLGTLQYFEKTQIMKSPILSLQWLNNKDTLACGEDGLLVMNYIDKEWKFYLPSSRERWLTAAIMISNRTRNKTFVCGDRAGNIYVYNVNNKIPIQTFTKTHGKMGVQSFFIFESQLITSGRDGMLRFYKIRSRKTEPLLMLHKKKMPMDWISGILKVHIRKYKREKEKDMNLVICGFKQVEFILYDLFNENMIVRIPCGGGHRSWDCIISQKKASFAYIRDKQIHVHDLSFSLFLSCPILQDGFHMKETRCLRFIDDTLFVSGGEDGIFRLSSISHRFEENHLRNSKIFNGHVSSIKCINIVKLDQSTSSYEYLIFSGGGRAELNVWGIVSTTISPLCSFVNLNSHMLYGQNQYCKKSWQKTKQSHITELEIRYMDICTYYSFSDKYVLVFVACADGFLRLFVYKICYVESTFYLRVSTKCVDRCILKVHMLSHKSKIIVLTMSTDGKLRFFDFTDIVSKIYEDADSENQIIVDCNDISFAEFRLHQSGINCFDLTNVFRQEDKYLLITGGDDNLLSIICFHICISENNKLSIEILSKWSTVSAHSTQIVGVKFHNFKIYSVGTDQQLIVYNYLCPNGVIHVDISKQLFTSITDVQGMEIYPTRKDEDKAKDKALNDFICIYGRGFEILSI